VKEKILAAEGVSETHQDEVISYIKTNAERFRTLSLRTPMQCLDYLKNPKYKHCWQDVADSILLRGGR
jgi:hypothetical protein